jgi:hypothetical protein
MFDKGDQVRVSVTFTNTSGGTRLNPTTVTLKIKTPSETTTQYVYPYGVNSDETGVYYRDFQVTESGKYYYRWEGTGGNPSATESWFIVKPSEFA